jgi:hypothetical protein
MQAGQRIQVTKTGRVGRIIELRNTPNGQSVKVKLDDAKAASWYWVTQITAEV